MEANLYRADASSLDLKSSAMDARRARSALVVGSRSSWSFRNWTLSKATVLTGSDSGGGRRRRATANCDGYERQNRRDPERGNLRASARDQTFALATAPAMRSISRDHTGGFD